MRSAYINPVNLEHVLAALTYENGLVMRVAMRYGLRVGDVLELKPEQIRKGRFTIKEQKTNKSRRISIHGDLQQALLEVSGRYWVFSGRNDKTKHRTRQAVYKDVKRAAKAFRFEHVSPHSARKCYAVMLRKSGMSFEEIQERLNHSDLSTTLLYALSDNVSDVVHVK